jgi:endogenous inhibitor of DNA gyrase (YacG/DUF329 family)
MNCPICECSFLENGVSVAMPFCSVRCKQIDAARWLDERYGLPYESEETASQRESDVLEKE